MNQLKQVLTKLGYATQLLDLAKAQNVAIVLLRAVIPSDGVHKGDHIDVRVASLGAATSLKGGTLFICPMSGPDPRDSRIYGFSSGDVKVEDITEPNVGTIHGGCGMEVDLLPKIVDNGKFTLVLEGPAASWTTANTIATIINDLSDNKEETLATAINSKTVVVTIPPTEMKHPDAFISRVLQLPVLLLPTEARVVINDHDGTMVVTGDVEISPVIISHKGLTISTVDPKPTPTRQNPVTTVKDIATIDTTQQGGAKLEDLAIAFDQLKVPVADRIEIVTDLYRSGKLHAKLFINDKEL
jgi:flagellar P-ring protein precursor FlgI